MNQAPAPTELIPSPTPGAPSTLAVDTSPNAMRAIGTAAPRSNRKNTTPNVSSTVTVNKVGSNTPAPAPAANVKVNVSKVQ